MNTQTSTDLLTDLIQQKLALLEQLRDLSRRQTDLINDGNMTRLLSVLSAKQTLLNQLQHLQDRLAPFRQQDPETRRWRCPEARTRCQQLAERCETLLGEIMLVERQSEAELQRRRDATVRQLENSNSSQQATRAYIESPLPVRHRLDLSSEQ